MYSEISHFGQKPISRSFSWWSERPPKLFSRICYRSRVCLTFYGIIKSRGTIQIRFVFIITSSEAFLFRAAGGLRLLEGIRKLIEDLVISLSFLVFCFSFYSFSNSSSFLLHHNFFYVYRIPQMNAIQNRNDFLISHSFRETRKEERRLTHSKPYNGIHMKNNATKI